MISFIPEIYPDESVYSWIARMFVRSGYSSSIHFKKEILERATEYNDYNFINHFNKEFRNRIEEKISFKELLINHTLFKYYVRFMPMEKRKQAYEYGLNNLPGINKYISFICGKENYYLRYCPVCVKEDREKYGEAYFHIKHSIYELNICPIHKCKLKDTRIRNTKTKETKLLSLEEIVESLDIECVTNEKIMDITNYIYKIFDEELDLSSNKLVGDFLKCRLNKKYLTPRGTRVKQEELIKDANELYKRTEFDQFNKNQIRYIFNNEGFNSFKISLMSYYEGIKVNEICNLENSIWNDLSILDCEIMRLHKEGLSNTSIGRRLNISHDTVGLVIKRNGCR